MTRSHGYLKLINPVLILWLLFILIIKLLCQSVNENGQIHILTEIGAEAGCANNMPWSTVDPMIPGNISK